MSSNPDNYMDYGGGGGPIKRPTRAAFGGLVQVGARGRGLSQPPVV